MTYWIYSQGLPVLARADKLLEKQRVKPLTALNKSKKIADMDENSVQALAINDLNKSAIKSVYHNTATNVRQAVKYADDIMTTPVVSLFDNTTFSQAWAKFQEYRFRHFPVINSAKQIIGIVSDRDMFAESNFINKTANTVGETKPISQIMANQVITASPDTSIHEICQVMFSQHIGALPIVGKKHQILGLITRSDILRVLIKNEAMEFWV